jgi:hypothetical protein
MRKETATDVEVKFMLPKSAVAFIDFLCNISGMNREGWLRRTVAGDLRAYLDDPTDLWDEEWLKERFGLASFLSETA